jgi:large subunit ribosomal protein L4
MKVSALKSALNAKLRDQELLVLDRIELDSCKTKEFFKIVKNLKLNGERIRFIVKKIENNLKLASRNIQNVELEVAQNLNTYLTLDCKKIIFTKDALKEVEERIKRWLK